MQTRRRTPVLMATTAALAALALAGCGGPSDDAAPEGDFVEFIAAQVREASAAAIDPNGLGDAPNGPNGLGRPASSGGETGVGAPAGISAGERAAGQNQDGRGNVSADGGDANDDETSGGGGTSTSSGSGFGPNGIGSQSGDAPAVRLVDCEAFCQYISDCLAEVVGATGEPDPTECLDACGGVSGAIPETTAEISCILNAFEDRNCSAIGGCGAAAGGQGVDTRPTDPEPVPEPDSAAGAGCAQACQGITECVGSPFGQCVSECQAQAEMDAEATAEGIACVLGAENCRATVACIQ